MARQYATAEVLHRVILWRPNALGQAPSIVGPYPRLSTARSIARIEVRKAKRAGIVLHASIERARLDWRALEEVRDH